MDKIRVGLIGFGVSGKFFHAPLLEAHGGYQIRLVSTSRATEAASVLPGARVCAAAEEILASPDIDLVVNCAPNSFHYSYTAAALKSRKHVVVEKPFVNSVDEGRELIALAKSEGKTLSVFHNRRWDGDFLTIKKLLEAGEVGEVQQFESHFDRWRPSVRPEKWREQNLAGSGVFYDLGSHLLDQALNLFGIPDELTADIACQKSGGASDDYFHVVLKYGRMRAILHSSSFSPGTPRFQIWGSKGGLTTYGLDVQEDQLRAGLSPLDPGFGAENEKQRLRLVRPDTGSETEIHAEKGRYLEYYSRLHRCLSSGAENPVPAGEALRIIQLLELCRESSASGKTLRPRGLL